MTSVRIAVQQVQFHVGANFSMHLGKTPRPERFAGRPLPDLRRHLTG